MSQQKQPQEPLKQLPQSNDLQGGLGEQSLKDLLSKEIKDLQEQVRDRRAYLNEQEDIIAKAVDQGNEVIRSKRQELEEIRLEHEDLLRKCVQTKQKLDQVEGLKEVTSARTNELQATYEKRAGEMRRSLAGLQSQIVEASQTLQRVSLDTELRLTRVETKEKELAERQRLTEVAYMEMTKRRLKLESDEAVYNAK